VVALPTSTWRGSPISAPVGLNSISASSAASNTR
jgi:hypothetical protein